MRKTHPFGDVLARLRREKGHASAHAFFKKAGGSRALGISFPNYLALEKGRSLPKAFRIKTLLGALGLGEDAAGREELVRAYFVSLIGDSALIDELREASKPSPVSLEGEAARLAVRQRVAHLDARQWRVMTSDADVYLVDSYLHNTPGLLEIDDVAGATGLPVAKVAAAVKKLAAARLAELSGRKVRSLYAFRVIQAPAETPANAGIRAAISKRLDEIVSRGKLVRDYGMQVRLPERGVWRYGEHLDGAIELAAAYGDVEKTDDTSIYYIDVRVAKLAE